MRHVTWVCGHYVFNQREIKEAREKLYNNLMDLGVAESPETKVVDAVKGAVMNYVDAFDLRDLNDRLG